MKLKLKLKRKPKGSTTKRVRKRRVGRRVAEFAGVLIVALGAVLAAYELKGSDDEAKILGPPPVAVRVLAPGTFQAAHPFAPYYVVPDKRVASPADLSKASVNRFVTRPEAALSKGGQAGSPQIVRLELRATSGEQVTVKGVRFSVVSDAKPLKGWFTAQPACSSSRTRLVKVTLDARRRSVRYVDTAGASSRTLRLTLNRARPTVLELQAAAAGHRVAWTAELSLARDGGQVQKLRIDDGGKPFRVTSARASRGYAPTFGATGISGFVRNRGWDRGRITGC